MPSPVDKYFKEVKRDNPEYTDAQAWATAWSIYCKHKAPGSEHCHKDTAEYLKGRGKQALCERVVSRYLSAATDDEGDWEEALNEVPDLVTSAHELDGSLRVESDDDDVMDILEGLQALGKELREHLQAAESVEGAKDLWANLKEAQKTATKLKSALQSAKTKVRKEPDTVREAVSDATNLLRSLLRDLDALIPG